MLRMLTKRQALSTMLQAAVPLYLFSFYCSFGSFSLPVIKLFFCLSFLSNSITLILFDEHIDIKIKEPSILSANTILLITFLLHFIGFFQS